MQKKCWLSILLAMPLIGFSSGSCSFDDIEVARDCFQHVLKHEGLSTSTSPSKATKAQAEATLECLAKTSQSCATCCKGIFEKNNYNMATSEPGIREDCLTLW